MMGHRSADVTRDQIDDESYGQDSTIINSMDEIPIGSFVYSYSNYYQVEKFLGRGAYGSVNKCRKNGTDQRVALKFIKKNNNLSADKEVEAIKRLREFNSDKINIMTCFDWFRYDRYFCFTFELLDQSLYDFMAQRHWSPLKVSKIRAIAEQILISLTTLGQLGMIHTDVKINNIMLVDHVSTPFRVKLIDFGLCHLTSDLSEFHRIQAPAYRAPEVYLGFLPNEAVDMWGLACTLGELYLGRVMFPGNSNYEILSSIIHLLGQPGNRVLDKAHCARQYFTLDRTDGKSTWSFKTVGQYQRETGERISEISNKLQSLDHLVERASFFENVHDLQDLKEFVDLLKKMLAVNPVDRINPADALKHNFITMRHLPLFSNDSYVKEAFKIMSQCQPITEDVSMEYESNILIA